MSQIENYECLTRSIGGGLSRQFFTDLYLAASTGANGIPAILKGLNGQKLINMIQHYLARSHRNIWKNCSAFIVQIGLGLSCLASIFYYICTDKIESAVPCLTMVDVSYHQTQRDPTVFNPHSQNYPPLKKVPLAPFSPLLIVSIYCRLKTNSIHIADWIEKLWWSKGFDAQVNIYLTFAMLVNIEIDPVYQAWLFDAFSDYHYLIML